MSEWTIKRIEDLCFVNQSTYSNKENWPYINYLDTSNLTENRIEEIQKLNTASDKVPSRARRKVSKNDILYSTVRPNQKHYGIIRDPVDNMLASTGFAVLSAKNGVADPSYIYWFLSQNHVVNYLHSVADNSTSTYPSLKPSDIERLEISLPEAIGDQKKISAIFDHIDDKIENNRWMNETLEGMAQAIFKSWFVDFEPVHAKVEALKNGGSEEDARLAAMCAISGKTTDALANLKSENPEDYAQLATIANAFPSAFVNSDLGQIPEGWEVKPIDDCYDVTMGQSPKGDTYNEIGEGALFYQGRAEFGWRFPTPRLHTTDPKRMAKAGDVLMSVRAPVGDMNIALDECCVGRGLCALCHKVGGTTFSYYQLNSIMHKFDCFNGEGTVFGSINQKDLKSILVITPDYGLIDAFVNKVEAFDETIRNASVENHFLAETRDALLPKLLSGEIDVSTVEITEDEV